VTKNTGVDLVVEAKEVLRSRLDVLMEDSQKIVLVDRVSTFGSYIAFIVEKTSPDKYGAKRFKVACIDEKLVKTIEHPALVSTPYWSAGIVYGGFSLRDVKYLCIKALDYASINSKYEEKLKV
jgi:hypothetical protein